MELFLKGGAFLISETNCNDIFILEEFDSDSKMMLEETINIVQKEIVPNIF